MIAVVNRASAYVKDTEVLTSGRAGLELEFQFSSEWDGLGKTAVFKAVGADDKYVILSGNRCVIPAETLENAGVSAICGVYGTDGDNIIIPTVYFALGEIKQGTEITGSEPGEITQTLYNQVVALLAAATSELDDIKESAIKEIAVDSSAAGSVGTPSVSLTTDWVDSTDHSKGLKATFAFANLKGQTGNGIASITNNNGVITIRETNGTVNTFSDIANAITYYGNIISGWATAESARQANEAARQSAESTRASSESSRVTAESARVTAETSRATAESARATAETARSNAEAARASAEAARVAAEGARNTAETARETAEAERQAAEIKTVTASVDNTVGTPSVNVTKAGNNLNLAFSHMKGEKGDCNFATFEIDPSAGELFVNYTKTNDEIEFSLSNGYLEVEIA